MKKVIVIGAGLGGLSAAARLAAKNIEVEVYEKNSEIGGKLHLKNINGYRFDAGPSLLTMPFIFEEFFASVRRNMSDYVTVLPLDVACRYVYSNKSVFHNYTNPIKRKREVERVFPQSYVLFEKYMESLGENYNIAAENFIYKPFKLSSVFNSLARISQAKKLKPFKTCHQVTDSVFEDKRIVKFFDRYATYSGASPFLAPSTLNVIAYAEAQYGASYIKGGMWKLADAFREIAEEYGVKIHTNTAVKKLLVDKKQVVGVQLENGEEITCDAVVSNDDATHLYSHLLPEGIIRDYKVKGIQKREPSSSGFILCLGVNYKSRNLSHHNIFFSDNTQKEFEEIFKHKIPPTNPTLYVSISSKTDPTAAPQDKENWFVLVNTPYLSNGFDWETQKHEYKNSIIRMLQKKIYAHIDEHIEVEYMMTPADIAERYNANRGAIYGTSSNSVFQAFLRPKNKSPYVKGLYLATGSAHPGGGLPLVTLSGKFAAEAVMYDFKNEK